MASSAIGVLGTLEMSLDRGRKVAMRIVSCSIEPMISYQRGVALESPLVKITAEGIVNSLLPSVDVKVINSLVRRMSFDEYGSNTQN